MNIAIIRTVILYLAVTVSLRAMGKRQLGEMQPTEFVVAMLIAELAGIPIQDPGIPLVYGLFPILVLLSMEVILSYVTMKSERLRKLVIGSPSILIQDGVVKQAEMERQRLNMDDLMSVLRQKNVLDLSCVNYAILETDGKLSVLIKAANAPLSPRDVGQNPENMLLQHIIVCDGKLREKSLHAIQKDRSWLSGLLKARGFSSIKELLFLSADEAGNATSIEKDGGRS